MMGVAYAILFLLFAGPIVIFARYYLKKPQKSLKGKHVVVTGGSSGIGKCLAVLAAKEGAHVTILARDQQKLKAAIEEIEAVRANEKQKFTGVSVDVSDYHALRVKFDEIESAVGPIFGLMNCAGIAICGTVEEFTLEEIKTMIDVNYLGTLYPIQLMVPKLKQRKGFIVLTASQVALAGIYGYSVYSSCKFALRGLAECLDMELRPYDVSVTLALPPDTDTPGYEIENQRKPLETKLLSESAGIYQPEDVAKKILKDALAGHFFSYIGFESFILTTLCVGMSPFVSFLEVIFQSLLLGVLRIVSAFYVLYFQNIIKKCAQDKIKAQ